MIIVVRIILAIVISIASLLIALTIDRVLAPLPVIPQFLIQIPLLVLIMDTIRRLAIQHVTQAHGLTEDDVNGVFFFAAPLAALASAHLMGDIRGLLR